MSMTPDLEMQPINLDQLSNAHEPEGSKAGVPHPEVDHGDPEHETHGRTEATEELSPPPIQNIPGAQSAGRPGVLGKKNFGIKKATARKPPTPVANDPVAAAYDYTIKYNQEDAFGHELDENARVWHVYNDEAREFDADMIEEASDSLDILLVFTGLFSAILTTFVAQTSQALSTDNAAITVSLLKELIDLQRAQANGLPPNSVASAGTPSSPSGLDKWINGLWFTSLTLSLSDALLAVLAKQWLRQYHSRLSGNPKQRAMLRQFRYDGFERWSVRSIIGFLPMILHISLILFLTGLILFLIPLNTTMAAVTGTITLVLLATYLLTNILPLALIQCPYRTPLTNLIYHLPISLLARLRPFLSWAPYPIRMYLNEAVSGRRKDLNDREATAASSRDYHLGAPRSLLSMWVTTTNLSAKRIVEDSLPSIPIKSLHSMLDGEDAYQSVLLRDGLTSFLENNSVRVWRSLRRMNHNISELEEADKVFIRRTLLIGLITEETSREGRDLWFGFIPDYGVFSNCQVLASDLDLIFMALAASKCDHIGFSIIGDEYPTINPVDLHGEDALSWIIQHCPNLDIPDLPLVVWKGLWRKGGWDVSRFGQPGMSQEGIQVASQARELDEYVVVSKARTGCGLLSLSEFLKLRYLSREDIMRHGLDWIDDVSKL